MNLADEYLTNYRMDCLANEGEYFQLRKGRTLNNFNGTVDSSFEYIIQCQSTDQYISHKKYATYRNCIKILTRTFILLLLGSLPLLSVGQLANVNDDRNFCVSTNFSSVKVLLPSWATTYTKPLPNTIVLKCDNNSLTSIPDLPNGTGILSLANNRISSLFDFGLRNITAINLDNNIISEINGSVFQGLIFLKALSLKVNLITSLSWLKSLDGSNLLYLDLSDNVIDEINPKYFEKLHFLERLDLSHNQIAFIDSYSFATTRLRHLDLSANQLTDSSLRADSLARLNELIYLSLASNRGLTKIPNFTELGFSSPALETLDLHGLPLVNAVKFSSFISAPNLRDLNLSYSGIATLERGWLGGGLFKTLESLDLSFNRLSAIHQYSFVEISDSRDFSDPLSYKNTKFDHLPYVLTPSISQAQSDVRMLTFASYDTIMESDAKCYKPLEALTYLSLSNNPFLKFLQSNAFSNLPRLQLLFLQNCNISQAKIASDENQFKDNGIKLTLPSLTNIWLFNNPLYCDCNIKLIKFAAISRDNECDDVNMTSHYFVDSKYYSYRGACYEVSRPRPSWCILPQRLDVFPIFEIEPKRLTCSNEPYDLLFVLMIGPVTFAGSILLIFLCGSCSVFVRRIRRYNSGMYQLMDEKQALITRDYPRRVKERSALDVIFSLDQLRYSPTFTNSSEGCLHTNLVLGELRNSNSNLAQKPHHSSRGQLTPLPTSSRVTSRPLISLQQPTKKSKYRESSLSGNSLSGLIMKSCPDLSNITRHNTDFWRHEMTNDNAAEDEDLLSSCMDEHYSTTDKSYLEIPGGVGGGSISSNFSEASSNGDFSLREIKGVAYNCDEPENLSVSLHHRRSIPDSFTNM